MPKLWYDIEKAYFLDPGTGSVVKKFVVFRYGLISAYSCHTSEAAAAEVTRRLTEDR